MRHRKKKKIALGHDKEKRFLKNLASSLILYEKVRATSPRAKIIRSKVEKMITKGKAGGLHKKRQLFSSVTPNAARKVFEVLGPKYKDRAGGYTRMVRIGRAKDGTSMVQVELI